MNSSLAHVMISFAGWACDFTKMRLMGRFWLFMGMMVLSCGVVRAQTFQVSSTPVVVAVTSGINPLPVRVPISAGPSGLSLTGVGVTSDAAWVSPALDASTNSLVLTFSTGSLTVGGNYTVMVTLSDGTHSSQVPVTASVSALNVTLLRDDPTRSRTYGIQQNALNAGAVVVFNPITGTYVGSITVGKKPTDLAVSADGNELLAVCSVSQSIYAINLQTLAVTETISLPVYADWGQNDTSADVAYGPGNVIYYTDGAWAPVLHVLNRTTHAVLQNVNIDGNGFGDIVVSSDKSTLFGWVQYGWTAGWAGSYIAKYTINSEGLLTFMAQTSPNYPTVLNRDPLNTPAFVSADGQTVVIKQLAVSAAAITTTLRAFTGPVYAMSPNADVVSTQSAIYERATGNKLYDLPVSSTVQTVTSDYGKLVYFDATAKALKTVDLLTKVGPTVLGIQTSPVDKSVSLAPAQLQWSPLAGIDRYRVYLGTSSTAVTQATMASTEYLGEVTGTSIALTSVLVPGTTYYWRVDAVSDNDVSAGVIRSFTVSTIATSISAINAATVQGNPDYAVSIGLSSAVPSKSWTVTSSAGWVKFASNTGVTPATLQVTLDASQLPVGLNQATITITASNGAFTIPVRLQVDPLTLTAIRSDPGTTKVYAISEATVSGSTGAYLLEIDSLFKTITRVVPVGTGVTDLAIHHGDNRIYVPNWIIGSLLAVNLDSFAVERTYAVPPFAGVGYSTSDVYRLSAGGPGRLVVEAEDQWVKVSIFNTVTGAVLASTSQRQGGGAYDPTGRYYYHGDDNSSGSVMHKLDTDGDVFTQTTQSNVSGTNYYGSRTVVMSEDGKRVFWNGVAFDQNLTPEWSVGDIIYSVSGDGRYAFSQTKIYDVAQKKTLLAMPVSTAVSAYNAATGRLVVQNGQALGFYNLVGPGLLGGQMSPQSQAIIESPSRLQWTPMPGATSYRVYLGTSSTAVTNATTASTEYLGEVTTSAITLTSVLPAGQTYYWRMDVVVNGAVAKGNVQSFSVATIVPSVTSIEATTVQGNPNCAVLIGLSSAVTGKSWTATSSAPWVKFASNTGVTPATLQVTLDASQLATGLNQATITMTAPGSTFTIPVSLQVDALTLTVIRSDSATTKVYAISEAAAVSGSASRAYLLEIDSLFKTITRVVPVGTGATDLAIHHGDNRIYVPNWMIGSLLAVNLDSFAVERTYAVPPFAGAGSTADVYWLSAGGPGRLVVEAEDQWVKVSIFDTVTGAVLASTSQRQGGGAYDPAGRYYYHGDDNISNASIHKFDTKGDAFVALGNTQASGVGYYGSRVVVMSEDAKRVFWNGVAFDQNLTPEWSVGDIIYSASGDGRYAFSQTKIYDVAQKKTVLAMPVSTAVSAYNSATGRLVVQNGQTLGFYGLVGPGLLGGQMSPQSQAIVESPGQLQWTPMPGATSYRVYLGTSSTAVTNATAASAEYLGEVTTSTIALTSVLPAGQMYYWRMDVVVNGAVAKGDVQSFSVETVVPSVTSIEATTVRGNPNYAASIGLSSTIAGKSWTATSSAPWVKLANNAGVTPATMQVTLDASQLGAGLNQATITVAIAGGSVLIPVNLQVDALALTMMRSDPSTTKVYAISEAAVTTGTSRAYLLELDSLFKTITRVVPVGTGVTDLAIHHGDNRIYVPNWMIGSLMAVNLDSFAVERTYAVPPFSSYSTSDVYRVSAGGPGRLVVEAEDQWINVSIFNTVTGVMGASSFQRQGGGAYDPAGRYYYHGDDNSSGSMMHKLDTVGDVFAQTAQASVSGVSYYGSRTVVMSEDGKRVFWNGVVFDQNLTPVWSVGDIIYSVSGDGRYAFSQTKIYDVAQKKTLLAMPVSTAVSAYNSATGRLVAQNGQALGFYSLVGSGLSGGQMAPQNQALIESPGQLQWTPMPGATGYRVYLGTSSAAVGQATAASPEYLGEVSTATITLTSALPAGQTYYWRVDILVGDKVATGDIQSFSVVTITPSLSSINAATVKGNANYAVSVGLSSVNLGKSWAATSSAPWVKLASSTGVTPATLQVTLDASQLGTGLNQATITVTTGDGSVIIPVNLQVDPLLLTMMRSDPSTSKVYAISAGGATETPAAYLLEIDSRLEKITRVVSVGTGVTDLAIHHGDNRIYVPNWKIGSLLAVNLDSFAVERTYAVPPFAGVGYSTSDVYRVSAGGPGRLVVEAEDQWVKVSIFNTVTGTVLASTSQRQGGGGYDPTGRYYYHGDDNSSGAALHKFDTNGDTIVALAALRGTVVNYYGSRTVVVSDDGQRIFWNGSVYTSALTQEWSMGAEVYTATPNGRVAFGNQSIYDVSSRITLFAMPVVTPLCAYNSTSGKLVVPQGGFVGFYALNEGGALPAPVLSVGAGTSNSLQLRWVDNSLEAGFVLQQRTVGASDWTTVPTSLSSYETGTTVNGLNSQTAYEFRVRAISPVATSTWSNVVTVTTLVGQPVFGMPANLTITAGSPVNLAVTASGAGNHYTVTGLPPGMKFDETGLMITGTSNVVGHYTVTLSATNGFGTGSVQIDMAVGTGTQNLTRGHYAGLVSGDAPLLGAWKLDRTGNQFTGTFTCAGGVMAFKAAFGPTGDVRQVTVTGLIAPVTVTGAVKWDRLIDRVSIKVSIPGYTADTLDETGFVNPWNASAHPYQQAGVFTAVMLPEVDATANQPEGYGFLTLTITAAGLVQIQGETATGGKVTWADAVPANFNLPIYWKSGDAILWGILGTSVDEPGAPPVLGGFAWATYQHSSSKTYAGGFAQVLNVLGNRFQGGATLDGFFTNTNAPVLQLGGGGLQRIMKNLTQPFSLSGKGALLPPSNPYQVKLTINPSTGLVTGQASVTDPSPSPKIKAVKRTIAFRGIMVRNADGAGTDAVGGYFLLPDWDKSVRSGWMEINAP